MKQGIIRILCLFILQGVMIFTQHILETDGKSTFRFDGFHFHQLCHTYTSNLLSNGAAPKDVQELLGHSDVSTTMNIYAHSTRKAKRDSARLLDKVASNA